MRAYFILTLILFAATGTALRINSADELVFFSLTLFMLITLVIKGGRVDRKLFWIVVWIIIGLLFAQMMTLRNHIPVFVTTMGYWQLWRGHIAIAVGLLLLAYRIHIPSWPIVIILQFNLFFSLLQPFLGETFMSLIYPAGYMEYRSGILRTVGIFGNPNTNAFFISLYLLAIWKDLIRGKDARWGKVLFIVGFAALVTTGSRTSLLVVPFLLFLIWHVSRKWNDLKVSQRSVIGGTTRIWVVVLILGSLIFLSARQADSTSVGYSLLPNMAAVTNTENLSVGYFRAIATVYSFSHFLDNPVLGLGYGSYGTPASFAWPSPYLMKDGLLIPEDARGYKLSQLDILLPVILAESGGVGALFWGYLLWRLITSVKHYSRSGGLVFNMWIVALLIAMLSGAGLTHPVVIALIPFIMNWLLRDEFATQRNLNPWSLKLKPLL